MFGKEENGMSTQKIYLNEDEPTQDVATEVLDEVRDGDVYGWGTFFAWKDLERIYGSVNK